FQGTLKVSAGRGQVTVVARIDATLPQPFGRRITQRVLRRHFKYRQCGRTRAARRHQQRADNQSNKPFNHFIIPFGAPCTLPQPLASVGRDTSSRGYSRAPGQPRALASTPSSSIQTIFTDGGGVRFSGRCGIAAIISVHTGSGPLEPDKPVTPLSSRPIHTTARWLPLKPANQASR